MSNLTENFNGPETNTGSLIQARDFLFHYFIWFVFAFGIPGNIFSIVVIVRMSRPKLTTSLFFVGLLAVVDNIAIILKVVESQVSEEKIFMTERGCQFLYALGLILVAYANWILVIIAVERFTAVMFSLRIMVLWSVKRAVIVISILMLVMLLIHLHIFFTLTTKNNLSCVYKESFLEYAKLWFYVSSSVYAFGPATLMTIFNSLTIWKLWTSARERKNLFARSDLPSVESRHQERQVTIMLVILISVFILLTIPRCLYVLFIWQNQAVGYETNSFLDVLTKSFCDINHAVNFYLYFCFVKTFRHNCIGLCPYRKKELKTRSDLSTEHSELTNKNGESL